MDLLSENMKTETKAGCSHRLDNHQEMIYQTQSNILEQSLRLETATLISSLSTIFFTMYNKHVEKLG